MNSEKLFQIASNFNILGEPISITPYGNGHINHTYLLETEICNYILQRINSTVFPEPIRLMENMVKILQYLQIKYHANEGLRLIKTTDEEWYLITENDETWRLEKFVKNSISITISNTLTDFENTGKAIAKFQKDLLDFSLDNLWDTIPNFHNTPMRFTQLEKSIMQDPLNRVREVADVIKFIQARKNWFSTITDLGLNNKIPFRVVHNDAKIDNILFHKETREPICLIDLDTVMPGFSIFDFAEAVRSSANNSAEDEENIDSVRFSLSIFEAIAKGYLPIAKDYLNLTEIENLFNACKIITIENGMRFLSDYIMGDIYYRISRPKQNLNRCKTQLKLVEEMEKYEVEMKNIILNSL